MAGVTYSSRDACMHLPGKHDINLRLFAVPLWRIKMNVKVYWNQNGSTVI